MSVRSNRHSLWQRFTLTVLISAYVAVSALVYTDFPRAAVAPSWTRLERQGLGIWRKHNCQVCHQIYGFGGFQGPDLTNLVTDSRYDREFASILEEGWRHMPAFHLRSQEQAALLAFLRSVNHSGQSQPTPIRARRTVDPVQHLEELTNLWMHSSGDSLTRKRLLGSRIWTRFACGACHVPFAMGRVRASDLSTRGTDLSLQSMTVLFREGRGKMPAFVIGEEETEALVAYLLWVRDHRAELRKLNNRMLEMEMFSWRRVPWFEYKK